MLAVKINRIVKNQGIVRNTFACYLNYRNNGSKTDDKNDEGVKSESKKDEDVDPSKKEAAVEKLKSLNNLLFALKVQQEEKLNGKPTKLDLAAPVNRRKKIEKPVEENEQKTKESSSSSSSSDSSDSEDEAEAIKEEEKKQFNPKLLTAVKEAAEALGGDVKERETELMAKLKDLQPQVQRKDMLGMTNLLKGIKVDNVKSADEMPKREDSKTSGMVFGKTHQFPRGEEEYVWSQHSPRGMDNNRRGHLPPLDKLDAGKRLGIFSDKLIQETPSEDGLNVWSRLKEKELEVLTLQPPTSPFQEMILWTKQGKMWTFPINNEEGRDEEVDVGFHEHVLLERHLNEGFPSKGPIRVFMEMVCVGLSNNYHLTAKQKEEHIDWYRKYFKSNRAILEATGALDV